MTRLEAITAMRAGKKITHKYFTREEWATLENGRILLDDGVTCLPAQFWFDRQTKMFDDGWDIWKPIS